MNPTDEQLARRWQRGDGHAGALIAERYRQAVGAVAYAILGDASLAEDIMQSTFEKASQRVDTVKETAAIGGWLISMARNMALDVQRKRKRETALINFEASDNGNPGRDAELTELDSAIREAVAKLPQDHRELFMMKYVGGMKHDAIAKALGIRRDAVSQRLLRIRKRLRTQLEAFRP